MSLWRSRRNAEHKNAFVKNSALRWIRGNLRFNSSLPQPDYIQRLVEHFRESSSPESMRRVVFSPDTISYAYASASCHLPGAYTELFPCPHCTHTDEEDEEYDERFVEVFHVANAHEPNVCATVTFTMRAFAFVPGQKPAEYSFGVEFNKGCPNAPITEDHSARIALHIHTDVFIEALCFLTRSELETALLVSRRWSNVIGGAEGTLQQRRSFYMIIEFYGESSGMLSVSFQRREISGRWRVLRALTTRGLSQALCVVRSHLRNAYVEAVVPTFRDSVPPPGPPHEVLVDIPLPRRINWLTSMLHSLPFNSVIDWWSVVDTTIGFGSLPTLARCALGCVRELELRLMELDATWAQLANLLNQP
ncbi:hypothetical protein AAVH_39460, partial [Aphelenchoides avenae]